MKKIPTAARYEESTKTIRSVPENYWLASMDSWDGAVDHAATALLFAAAPEILAALKEARKRIAENIGDYDGILGRIETAIRAAEGAA